MSKSNFIPEIVYEEAEEGGAIGHIPFIDVPLDQEMPKILFVFESRNSGEFEIGSDGNPLPIVERTLQQYALMDVLKEKLRPELYDEVRDALGLKPMKEAVAAGRNLTDRVRKNLQDQSDEQ